MRAMAGIILGAVLLAGGPAHAAEPGKNGLSVSVSADGFFNPTIKSLKVAKVDPGGPAALAGIAPGDEIVEIEGIAVPGAKGDRLRPLMTRNAGEVTNMVLVRPSGEKYRARLVAVPKS